MSTIAPIFNIKEDLDPFYLYGAEEDYREPKEDAKLVLEPSLRVLQVPVPQPQQDDVFKDVKKNPVSVSRSRKPLPADARSVALTDGRVDKAFEHLEDLFCQIFETLISISEDPEAFLPDGDQEVDRAQKRNRDYESRLKKSLFETNQQVTF